jgi:hypothetical protein
MPLNFDEQARLARKYEPHLVLTKGQGFSGQIILNAPINPNDYIRQSALWWDAAPNEPVKDAWGNAAVGQRLPNFFPGFGRGGPGNRCRGGQDPPH